MSIKVLILEDNPVTRSFLARVVNESFSDVSDIVEVADLASARTELRVTSSPFQMILLDLELPDGSGLELLREVSNSQAMCIVTTLYADDEQLLPAIQSGADGYLLKENRFEVLVEDLQKIVRGQLPLSPALARSLLHHCRSSERSLPQQAGTTQTGSANPEGAACAPLTSRETDVLTYVSKGFTIKEMASLMGIKWFTVNDHMKSIYKKVSGRQSD